MDDRIFFNLSRTENRLKTYMKQRFRAGNITVSPAQIGILFLLKGSDGMPMTDLSRLLDIDNSAITRLVDTLETQGFVTREANPDDRRQFIIAVTSAGLAEAARAKKVVKEANELLRSSITERDLAIFMKVLTGINTRLGG